MHCCCGIGVWWLVCGVARAVTFRTRVTRVTMDAFGVGMSACFTRRNPSIRVLGRLLFPAACHSSPKPISGSASCFLLFMMAVYYTSMCTGTVVYWCWLTKYRYKLLILILLISSPSRINSFTTKELVFFGMRNQHRHWMCRMSHQYNT